MDWGRNRTLSLQVAEWLRNQIISGAWKTSEQIPGEQELCVQLKVSRATLRNALMALEREGLLSRRHGVGTFVREELVLNNNLSLIVGTTDMIRSIGMEPGIAEITLESVPAGQEIAHRLAIPQGESVIQIQRVQTANQEKLVYSTDIFKTSLLDRYPGGVPTLEDLRQYIWENISLYHLLQNALGYKIDHSLLELRPVNAPSKIAIQLGVKTGAALMYIEQVDYDIEECPLLFSAEYHAGATSIFTVNRQRQ